MTTETQEKPSVDELTAKQKRLETEVGEARKSLDVAKKTFADAAKSDPTAVETLLELAAGVKAAEKSVSDAERGVARVVADIAGIHYDEQMASVTEATASLVEEMRQPVADWFAAYKSVTDEFAIDTLTLTAKITDSGVTVSAKPSGENMPKRPSGGRGGTTGERGPRGKRSVTVASTGETLSCREYVKSCGDQASPAAQADLAGTWDGAPVSYTNEAKRLATANGDTFN